MRSSSGLVLPTATSVTSRFAFCAWAAQFPNRFEFAFHSVAHGLELMDEEGASILGSTQVLLGGKVPARSATLRMWPGEMHQDRSLV